MDRAIRKILGAIYGFMKNPRIRYSFFMEGARRVFFTYDTREEVMKRIMEFALFRNLKGDYMEFGVYAGNSFIMAFHFAKFIGGLSSMNFYAFDTFSGYPPLEGIDKWCGYFREESYACDLETFKKHLKRGGVDMEKVVIIPGPFENLNDNVKREIKSQVASVVWIDCDLYKATFSALEFVTRYITDGTIIVLADWLTCNGAPGMCQPGALEEWLKAHPEIHLTEFPVNAECKVFVISQPEKQKINKVLYAAPKQYGNPDRGRQ